MRIYRPGPLLSPQHRSSRGGRLPGGRRRRSYTSLVVLAGVLGAWLLWEPVVHKAPPPAVALVAVATRPAGPPSTPSPPSFATRRSAPSPSSPSRPVAEALVRIARDHVARRVRATWGSVTDADAGRGADVDLVARGLALIDFPLRDAIVRHRFRAPHRYGLARRPLATVAARRHALTTANLLAFLGAYAIRVSADPDPEALPDYQPGDVVFIKPSRHRARLLAAIVSAETDDEGNCHLYTLNPADGTALVRHTVRSFPLRGHFRLDTAHLSAARTALGLATPPRVGVTL